MSALPFSLLYQLAREDERTLEYVARIEEKPSDHIALTKLGEILLDNKYFSHAITCLDEATRLNPTNIEAWIHKAKAFFALDKYDKALSCLDEVTKSNITDTEKLHEVWLYKAKANSHLGKYRDAIKCYEEALKIKDNDPLVLVEKGNALYSLKEYDQALTYYERFTSMNSKNPEPWIKKGLALTAKGEYERAEKSYKKALDLDPGNLEAKRNLAYLYSDALFLYDKAETLCRDLYRIDPSPEWGTYCAETLLKVRKFPDARWFSDEVIEETLPSDIFYQSINKVFTVCSYLLEGNTIDGKRELDDFLDYWKDLDFRIAEDRWVFKGLKNSISSSDANQKIKSLLLNLIAVLEGRNNDIEALHNVELRPNQENPLNLGEEIKQIKGKLINMYSRKLENVGRGKDYLRAYDRLPKDTILELKELQDITERLDIISDALKIHTSYQREEYFQRAYLLTLQGKHEQASKIYDNILKEEPTNIKALVNKGLTLYRLGDYDGALVIFDKALEVEPNRIDTIVNKGLALSSLGRNKEAIRLYVEATRLNPLPGDIEDLVSKGIALNNIRKHEEAILQFDQALRINPKYEIALINKGISYEKLGKHEEARSYYSGALEINPYSALALYNRSCSFSLQGIDSAALEDLKKAIELDRRFKSLALNDDDFTELKSDKRFINIINAI